MRDRSLLNATGVIFDLKHLGVILKENYIHERVQTIKETREDVYIGNFLLSRSY